eukprot:s7_g41.t1
MPFAEAPVVVVTPTETGTSDPASIRLKDITTSGFSAIVAKPPNTAVGDDTMTESQLNVGTSWGRSVTFLAAAPGVRQLAGVFLAPRFPGLPGKKWQKIAFAHEFPAPPAFLSSVGVNSVKVNEAWVALEMAETTKYGQVNQDEVVGYIAIESGAATLQSTAGSQVKMAAVVSGRSVRGWKTGKYDVALGTDLSVGAPLAVASQCTHYGGDGGWARLRGTDRRASAWSIHDWQHASFIVAMAAPMGKAAKEVPVSWVAGPFGTCIRVCPGSRPAFGRNRAVQKREVKCYSLNAEQLEDFRCEHLMKPQKYRRCHCGVLSCPKDCSDCEDDEPSDNSEFGESRDSEFELVGCFPLGDGDVTGETEEAADFECRDWTDNSAACRSGLPILDRNHELVSQWVAELKRKRLQSSSKLQLRLISCAAQLDVVTE